MGAMMVFKKDELFIYQNGKKYEIGKVKRPNNDGTGYFCYYHTGDTAANTPVSHMHKLVNDDIKDEINILNDEYMRKIKELKNDKE